MKLKYLFVLMILIHGCSGNKKNCQYPIQPVSFKKIKVDDKFWTPRIKTNRNVTIPHCFKKCSETGRIDNFTKAAHLIDGEHQGNRYDDSDVYKIMEGAFYSIDQHYDRKMDTFLDSLIILIAEAQENDGYLFTARTINPGENKNFIGPERWSLISQSHELYNAGHLYEAAVASYQSTGKEVFLDVAMKNADLICNTFGSGKREDAPGHQEIEIGLAKLYCITGDEKYMNLAQFFLNMRGNNSHRITNDSLHIYQYNQNHKPVVKQEKAVGHAVRGFYMYSAMADLAAFSGHQEYLQTLDKIWNDVVSTKMCITGGVGSSQKGESFADEYELANSGAYSETCSAIGHVMFNHRLFLLQGKGKYIDVLERTLYNGLLSGVSLKGDSFFYFNPLKSNGKYLFNKGSATRKEWFDCACCPSNIARFMPSIPQYIYAKRNDELYINLFMGSSGKVSLKHTEVNIHQQTNYPWDGHIKIRVIPEKETKFVIKVRIPGWARNKTVPGDLYEYIDIDKAKSYTIKLNKRLVTHEIKNGYAVIKRKWRKNDLIELDFPMPVRRVKSHKKIEENLNKIALERGPILYCIEEIDNGPVGDIYILDHSRLISHFRDKFLDGVVVITANLQQSNGKTKAMTAVPYYAWSNRGVGEMAVWINHSSKE